MDDDPEPSLDDVVLGNCEVSEQSFNVGESHEVSVHQEGGDNGPFMDQEPTKKPVLGKDVPDQAHQAENKEGMFRRKELMDQSQPPDVSGSIKSSVVNLRKPSRRSIARISGQESRRSSQQSVGVQSPLSMKSSRTQSISESDSKDITWVSKRTGKLMKCRTQQTSLIWEQKSFSDILSPSSDDSDQSREGSMETLNILDEAERTFSEETMSREESLGNEGRLGSQQLEVKGSKRSSLKRDSRRSSQRSMNETPLLLQKGICLDEDISWISQKTGKEMKCKAQQTSIIWELKTLSEILHTSSQESFPNTIETDTTELEDNMEEAEAGHRARRESQRPVQQPGSKPAMGQESRRSSQVPEARKSWQDTQKLEEEKPMPYRKSKTEAAMYEQAQQTDSTESLKEELLDHSQQRDALVGPQVVSRRSSWQEDAQIPQHANQDLVWEESQPTITTTGDFQRGSRQPQGIRKDVGVGQESEVPTGFQSKATETTQELPLEQGTWISRRTGKVVKSRSQQTDKSWLQYCVAKRQKVKKCTSQQTDESFLQDYAARKTKKVSSEFMPAARDQQGQARTGDASTMCENKDSRDSLLHDLAVLSPQNELYGAEMAKEDGRAEMVKEGSHAETVKEGSRAEVVKEDSHAEAVKEGSHAEVVKEGSRAEVVKEGSHAETMKEDSHAEVVREGSRPEVVKEGGRAEMLKEDGRAEMVKEGSWRSSHEDGKEPILVQAVKDPKDSKLIRSTLQWPDDSEQRSFMEDASPFYMAGEDDQIYSIISVEDGIWMNRRTGKLVVSHVQQTCNTAVTSISKTSLLGKGGGSGGAFGAPGSGMDGARRAPGEPEREEAPSGQESHCGSQQESDRDASLIIVKPIAGESQCADDVTKLLSRRLSEAMLLSVESPDVGDETALYTAVSVEKGSWVNLKTGQLLESQSQQTEEHIDQVLVEDVELLSEGVSQQPPPAKGPVGSPEPSRNNTQGFGREGLVGSAEPSRSSMQGPVGSPEPSRNSMQGPVGSPEPSRNSMQGFGREGLVSSPEASRNSMQGFGREGPVRSPEPRPDNVQGFGADGMDDDPISGEEQPSPAGRRG